MRIRIFCISLIILLLSGGVAYSEEVRTEIRVDFRVNSTTLDRGYSDNAERLAEIVSFLQRIKQDSTITILKVSFCGAASPEGSYQYNHKLARGRLMTLENMVRSQVELPDSIITRDDSYISWDYLREQVEQSDIPYKQDVLEIISQKPRLVNYWGDRLIDQRIINLRALNGGIVWRQLFRQYFAQMRNACGVFITYKKEKPLVEKIAPIKDIIPPVAIEKAIEPKAEEIVVQLPQQPVAAIATDKWIPRLHIKTNALGWGLAISNIAVEADVAKHWSVTIPIYYSALNYFTSTIKFRTLAVQPEARYWLKEDNCGLFAGAHFGVASYNIAVNGGLRYQDHDGKAPALGGGISVGYRMPISKNERWNIEFTLGAGVYALHYDTFYNVNNGRLVDTYKKTYWGLDNAAVGISYRFDLNKRKR